MTTAIKSPRTAAIKAPRVRKSLSVVLSEAEHDAEVVAMARRAVCHWDATRKTPNNWSLRWAADKSRRHAENDVIGIVRALTGGEHDDTPCSMVIDGRRFIVSPEPDTTTDASCSLVVEDADTGERLAYCPSQEGDSRTIAEILAADAN